MRDGCLHKDDERRTDELSGSKDDVIGSLRGGSIGNRAQEMRLPLHSVDTASVCTDMSSGKTVQRTVLKGP